MADTIIADREAFLAAGERRFEEVNAPGIPAPVRIRSMTGREFERHLARVRELTDTDEDAFLSAVYLLQDSICDADGELMFRADADPAGVEYYGEEELAKLPHGAITAITKAATRLNGKHSDPETTEKN